MVRSSKIDFNWINEATHVIAVINGPSHGVGMEIQRAKDKPKMGMNVTPILSLVDEGLFDNVTWMLRGVAKSECPVFELRTYSDLKSVKTLISEFLTKYPVLK